MSVFSTRVKHKEKSRVRSQLLKGRTVLAHNTLSPLPLTTHFQSLSSSDPGQQT